MNAPKKFSFAIVAAGFWLLLVACDAGRREAKGFRLPEGNATKGKDAFVALGCCTCHRVEGAQLPEPTASASVVVTLGGEVARVRTYGDLVTSIIHPSEKFSSRFNKEGMEGKLSPMGDFNRAMTVEQLIDLVAFLHPRYRQIVPQYGYYQ